MTAISPELMLRQYFLMWGPPTQAKVITPLGQLIKAQQLAKCEIVVRLNVQVQNLSLAFYLHIDKRRQGEGSGRRRGEGGGAPNLFSSICNVSSCKEKKKKKSPGDAAGRLTSALPGFTGTNRKHTLSLPGGSRHSGLTLHLM